MNNQSRTFNQSFIQSPDFCAVLQPIKQCPTSSSKGAIFSISVLCCVVKHQIVVCCRIDGEIVVFCDALLFFTGVLMNWYLNLGYLDDDDHLVQNLCFLLSFLSKQAHLWMWVCSNNM